MRLGVMQGRLCPPIGDKIQAFPGSRWADEFAASRELGLDAIEWVFERPDYEANPLLTDSGVKEMREASREYGVVIGSVVADYFMVERLFGEGPGVKPALEMLRLLFARCRDAKIPLVELPFVDSSALKTEADKKELVSNLQGPLEEAYRLGVTVSLETSLPPAEFNSLLAALRPHPVKVNFDMGNSASLGFAPAEEIPALAHSIANVHIKDRVHGGGTVPLGTGDVDFPEVFARLAAAGYSGDFIFQCARQDLSTSKAKKGPKETILEYLEFVRPLLKGFPAHPALERAAGGRSR